MLPACIRWLGFLLTLCCPALAFGAEPSNERPEILTGEPEGGLAYRLHLGKPVEGDPPARLVVWLHPSGGSMNDVAERLAPALAAKKFALVVFTDKKFAGWSATDSKKLESTLQALKDVAGLSVERPFLLGYSAGGQMAIQLWTPQPDRWGGLILDAAYPVEFRGGKYEPAELPQDAKAVKRTPIYVLVGDRDGGSMLWKSLAPKYAQAEIPLTVEYVSGKGHAWLVGKDQTQRLVEWLDRCAQGEFPTGTIGTAPDKPPVPTPRSPRLGVALDETRVTQVLDDSPAARAGVQVNDHLISLDGKPVTSRTDVAAVLTGVKSGSTLKLTVKRGDQELKLSVDFQ